MLLINIQSIIIQNFIISKIIIFKNINCSYGSQSIGTIIFQFKNINQSIKYRFITN